jgi:hypothetical protein
LDFEFQNQEEMPDFAGGEAELLIDEYMNSPFELVEDEAEQLGEGGEDEEGYTGEDEDDDSWVDQSQLPGDNYTWQRRGRTKAAAAAADGGAGGDGDGEDESSPQPATGKKKRGRPKKTQTDGGGRGKGPTVAAAAVAPQEEGMGQEQQQEEEEGGGEGDDGEGGEGEMPDIDWGLVGDVAPCVTLRLTDTEETRAIWPHKFQLDYKVRSVPAHRSHGYEP